MMCDECNRATHFWCLKNQICETPRQVNWYCDVCRNESHQQIEQQNREYLQAKKVVSTKWGFGMACSGRTPNGDCSQRNTFGPIPDVPVGTWWRFRVQASEDGVHRPLVSGIHGKESDGAYSIVFSGLREEDADLGNELYYTASGGRGGKSRTGGVQVRDQELKRENKALAMNCWAPFDGVKGASAGDNWRLGKPVRVLRSGNARHQLSKYQPKIGVRYDGIYKVVKYWSEFSTFNIGMFGNRIFHNKSLSTFQTECGFRVWRFHLRRDDTTPAPWTEAGRYLARKYALLMKYPPGWSRILGQKRKWSMDQKMLSKKLSFKVIQAKCIQTTESSETIFQPRQLELIHKDISNLKTWTSLLEFAQQNEPNVGKLETI